MFERLIREIHRLLKHNRLHLGHATDRLKHHFAVCCAIKMKMQIPLLYATQRFISDMSSYTGWVHRLSFKRKVQRSHFTKSLVNA